MKFLKRKPQQVVLPSYYKQQKEIWTKKQSPLSWTLLLVITQCWIWSMDFNPLFVSFRSRSWTPELALSKQPLRPVHSDPMVLMTTSLLAAADPRVEVEEGDLTPSADWSSKKSHRLTRRALDSPTDNTGLNLSSQSG